VVSPNPGGRLRCSAQSAPSQSPLPWACQSASSVCCLYPVSFSDLKGVWNRGVAVICFLQSCVTRSIRLHPQTMYLIGEHHTEYQGRVALRQVNICGKLCTANACMNETMSSNFSMLGRAKIFSIWWSNECRLHSC